MIGINSVTIIGNIGTISDIMTTSNGARFVNLTIATTETYYSANNEKKNNTQWHNVVIWNNMAELQKMLSKGDLIYVEGRLNYRKKSVTQIFTEIVAKNIRVLSKKNYDSSNSADKGKYDSEIQDFDYSNDNEDFLITRTFDNE
jgi:single-strand DNA-binding protein